MASFLSRTAPITFSKLIFPKKKGWINLTFSPRPRTFPLENVSFAAFIKLMFLQSKKACFLSRTAPNKCFSPILARQKVPRTFKIFTKTKDYPVKKNVSF